MQNNVQTINGVTWFDSLEERNAFLKQMVDMSSHWKKQQRTQNSI